MSNTELVLRELRVGLQGIYGDRLEKIILFGSEARGDARSTSDIDILLVLKGPVKPSYEIDRLDALLAEINLTYGRLVGIVPISVVDYEIVEDPFLRNVQREGILL